MQQKLRLEAYYPSNETEIIYYWDKYNDKVIEKD